MNTSPGSLATESGAGDASPPMASTPSFWRRITARRFLLLSIVAHLLFGGAATLFVVQTISAKRKLTFTSAPPSPTHSTQVTEHRVEMAQKRKTMSAPAQAKRITTTAANTRVALPAMPAMPAMASALTPAKMAGVGGAGFGVGTMSAASTGSAGGGGPVSLFGFRDAKSGTLVGTFFDFKQTPDQRATAIAKNGPDGRLTDDASNAYTQAISAFVQGGMHDNTLAGRYFKAPNPLYATQIFIPQIEASEGPKAFNLQGRVQPSRFVVHYRATVIPPESGTFHFVGFGDDVLVVRFDNQTVLDCGIFSPTGRTPERFYMFDGLPTYAGGWWKGCGESNGVNVEAGKGYPIDILISEWGGGQSDYYLLIRKDGVDYKKDSHGNPILPLFRLADGKLPYSRGAAPVYQADGPIWKATAAPPDGSP